MCLLVERISAKYSLSAPSKYFLFIGYQTFALELKHIMEPSDNMKHPNVRTNYTVTDKADGDRNLLFINKEGKMKKELAKDGLHLNQNGYERWCNQIKDIVEN